MDIKTRNYLIIAAGIVFLLIGLFSIMASQGIWYYITFILGIIIIVLGLVGLKQGRVIG